MKDKEFLERIEIAWNVYKRQTDQANDIEKFIVWLYKEYGFVRKRQEDKK